MKKSWINKAAVFGIIILFVGINIVPANTNTFQNKAKDKDDTELLTQEQDYYNLIGGVNVTFDFLGTPTVVEIEWWAAEDRNFTYPIDPEGNVEVNYTLRFQTYSKGIYIIPRFVRCTTSCYYPIDRIIGYNSTMDIVPFTQFDPGFVDYMVTKSIKMPTPPPDQGSDKTRFATWNYVEVLTIPPVQLDDESRPYFYHHDPMPIPFWFVPAE